MAEILHRSTGDNTIHAQRMVSNLDRSAHSWAPGYSHTIWHWMGRTSDTFRDTTVATPTNHACRTVGTSLAHRSTRREIAASTCSWFGRSPRHCTSSRRTWTCTLSETDSRCCTSHPSSTSWVVPEGHSVACRTTPSWAGVCTWPTSTRRFRMYSRRRSWLRTHRRTRRD
jgi:hypothetical protein